MEREQGERQPKEHSLTDVNRGRTNLSTETDSECYTGSTYSVAKAYKEERGWLRETSYSFFLSFLEKLRLKMQAFVHQ